MIKKNPVNWQPQECQDFTATILTVLFQIFVLQLQLHLDT